MVESNELSIRPSPAIGHGSDQIRCLAAFTAIDLGFRKDLSAGTVQKTTREEFRRVTEVTYLGYAYGMWAALKRMLPRSAGVIVQVGSALAYGAGQPLVGTSAGNVSIRGVS